MKTLFFLFFAVILLMSCQSKPVARETVAVAVAGGSYQNVTPTELQTMMQDKNFVFINVHVPLAGNIPNTDLSIPYDQIEQNVSRLPANKDAKIVLYCRSGRMSEIAAEKLVSLGYTDVWNLQGGMVDWEQAGFDLEK